MFHNGGTTPVDTETVSVSGNGTYTTPTGFTLPSTGTATGTYQWDAIYSGDPNNSAANDTNSLNEQVTVSLASPTIITAPSPTTVTLGPTAVTLNDAADLKGAFHATGTITFTLFHNGGTTPVDSEMVAVTGNGTYTTPTGYTLPTSGTVTGTYLWHATYSGDGNNDVASDVNNSTERVTVSAASPTLSTTPDPTTVTLGPNPVTLTDKATLEGGSDPTGTITFTLFHNGGTTSVHTETVTVSGNGTYTTPTGFTLPSTGATTGAYQWDATYSGDTNNATANDTGSADERVAVSRREPHAEHHARPDHGHARPQPGNADRYGHAGARLQSDGRDHLHTVPQWRHNAGIQRHGERDQRQRPLHVDGLPPAKHRHGKWHLPVGRDLQRRRQQRGRE